MATKKCFSKLPAHIFECVSEYIPFVSKKVIANTQIQTKNQKNYRKHTNRNKKAKETNEEKRHTKETNKEKGHKKETKEEKEKENAVAVNSV